MRFQLMRRRRSSSIAFARRLRGGFPAASRTRTPPVGVRDSNYRPIKSVRRLLRLGRLHSTVPFEQFTMRDVERTINIVSSEFRKLQTDLIEGRREVEG
jgi:hypothetical protein